MRLLLAFQAALAQAFEHAAHRAAKLCEGTVGRQRRERRGIVVERHSVEEARDLAAGMGAPQSLKSLGMKRADLGRAADLAVRNSYYNPRAIAKEGIRQLLEDAFEGRAPLA